MSRLLINGTEPWSSFFPGTEEYRGEYRRGTYAKRLLCARPTALLGRLGSNADLHSQVELLSASPANVALAFDCCNKNHYN